MRFKKQIAAIPMCYVGPVQILSQEVTGKVLLPLATFEAPLWSSTHRGAKVVNAAGGVQAIVLKECMTRSILLEACSAQVVQSAFLQIRQQRQKLQDMVKKTSRFAQLLDMHEQIVGPLLYLRFEFLTGDAAGHNMVTLASEQLLDWILAHYPQLHYVSLSGNYCSDKKVSAVNGILGRGKSVIAEVNINRNHCRRYLKTTPEQMIDLNLKKNWLGSMVAGGLRTANAHFSNLLLAFYLATGQDGANIIEASQGMVYSTLREDHLYFSVTLPHLIVGTVGSGKNLSFVQENLQLLGCLETQQRPGYNARRLAIITAVAVLCGELSLLAALTNRGELMRSHLRLERGQGS